MNGKRLMAMGLIVTLSVSAAACGKEETTAEVSKVAVEVQTPEIGELSVDTAYIGSVTPEEQVYVIPKTSGTVTEVNFSVGDTVQEGDVLFKIDDEAAQLQLESANAAYESAQAGVTAQTSGARDLQNYQTERQIQLLKDTLYDNDGDLEDMEDNLGDIRDAIKQVESSLSQAQAGVDALTQEQISLEAELKNLEAANPQDSDAIINKKNAIDAKKLEIITGGKSVSQLQAQLDSLNATKTQLKTGIESLESGMDTIRDNITTAEQAYAITQNEVYPQSDAASAASLSQAAVGIDSAKMQLDFCTVKAPISGIVEAVTVEKNGMAAAGSYAFIISNKDSMTVTFHVTEKAKNALSIGDHITVERNGVTYDGAITEIGTMAGMQTKLFQIKASVTGASDSLPNGVSVKVYATTQKESGKLIIPYDSVYFVAGDASVYCVENGVIVKTPVEVGLMNDTEVVIEEGLTEDSLVVENWSSKLRDGVEVEVISVNGEAAEAEMAVPEEAAEEPEAVEEEEAAEEPEAVDGAEVTEEAE